MAKTRVVVVDDSALIRSLLKEIIDRQPDKQYVGVAADPFAAREVIRNTDPDVITLDVAMARMDGIDFVAKPKVGMADGTRQLSEDITDKIRTASKAQVRRAPTAAASAGDAAARRQCRRWAGRRLKS